MTTTIVQSATSFAVQSPYNREFAYAARLFGGDWNRTSKVWEFSARYTRESIVSLVSRFYPDATFADALPVPEALPSVPDAGFYGAIGDTVTLSLEITKTVDFNGQYGASRLHCMKDASGHVFTWYAATARYETGQTVRLMGKIKNHNEYKGTSQTVLTRCKKI
jgi:hypothetical protein